MDITGLPEQIFTSDKLESYGEANYLKGGVVYADAITTVSASYAQEITTPEGGEGLHGLMQARSGSLYGIVNGIDYKEYNPGTDPYLPVHFATSDFAKKKVKNKLAFQKELSLPEDKDVLLLGMVSRMTDQKGFDLINYILDELLSTEQIQLVTVGTGEQRYVDSLNYFQAKFPDKMHVYIGYSEEMAHKVYGSCDAFLMPSLFEPCGLSQLMSLRYGTVPIVRETGGLRDTVIPYNEYDHTGTGFSFTAYNAHDMLHVIRYALDVYKNNRKEWNALAVRGMKEDFSWTASARKYEQLYDGLTE
jgi:starch synthase